MRQCCFEKNIQIGIEQSKYHYTYIYILTPSKIYFFGLSFVPLLKDSIGTLLECKVINLKTILLCNHNRLVKKYHSGTVKFPTFLTGNIYETPTLAIKLKSICVYQQNLSVCTCVRVYKGARTNIVAMVTVVRTTGVTTRQRKTTIMRSMTTPGV